jgi:hypothetical protein
VAAQGGGRPAVAYESADRVDISLAGAADRVTGVLVYRYDGDLGWRLREAISCG